MPIIIDPKVGDGHTSFSVTREQRECSGHSSSYGPGGAVPIGIEQTEGHTPLQRLPILSCPGIGILSLEDHNDLAPEALYGAVAMYRFPNRFFRY